MNTHQPETLLGELLLEDFEVARLLRVSVDSVRNLHRVDQLRGVMIGKHLRWRPSDVQTYVKQLGTK